MEHQPSPGFSFPLGLRKNPTRSPLLCLALILTLQIPIPNFCWLYLAHIEASLIIPFLTLHGPIEICTPDFVFPSTLHLIQTPSTYSTGAWWELLFPNICVSLNLKRMFTMSLGFPHLGRPSSSPSPLLNLTPPAVAHKTCPWAWWVITSFIPSLLTFLSQTMTKEILFRNFMWARSPSIHHPQLNCGQHPQLFPKIFYKTHPCLVLLLSFSVHEFV